MNIPTSTPHSYRTNQPIPKAFKERGGRGSLWLNNIIPASPSPELALEWLLFSFSTHTWMLFHNTSLSTSTAASEASSNYNSQKQGGHFSEILSPSEKLNGISSVVSTGTLLLPNGDEYWCVR